MFRQTVAQICFDFFSRLPIVVEPKEVQVSSDTGILPIRQFDDQIGLTHRFIACLEDPRDPNLTDHSFAEMVRQRFYGIVAGYEDCNDHDTLRGDPVFKMVAGREPQENDLASQPTLSRFENAIDIPSLWRLHDFFIDEFIRSFQEAPLRITLDLDATDDPCHGQQQLALFHGFFDQYQYFPLMISCAETQQTLWAALRPGAVHAALGADDDLEYVVNRLRTAWPDVVIYVRGDAGFGMPWMYEVCERMELMYTFGLSTNAVLKRATEGLLQRAVERFEQTRESTRLFDERGESENRHKELKNGFAGDRLSCHRFLANYFRLQLHCAALNLLIQLRTVVADPPALTTQEDHSPDRVPVADPTLPVEALTGQERRRYHTRRRRKDPLGKGHIATWQMMLIKVAGQVTQSARRILITIPAHWPHWSWFRHVCQRIAELRCRAQAPT